MENIQRIKKVRISSTNSFLSKHLLLLSLIFCFQQTYAQLFNYKNYTIADGLPSSQVYNVVQDSNGYLWFATDHGISRYDGYEFVNFDTNDGLPDNVVLHLYQQENGDIWGTTLSGALFYFNPTDYVIKEYLYNSAIKKIVKKYTHSSLYIYSQTVYLGFHGIAGFIKINATGTIQDYTYSGKTEVPIVVDAVKRGSTNTSSLSFFYDKEKLKDLALEDFDLKISHGEGLERTKRHQDKTFFTARYFIEFKGLDVKWRKKLPSSPTSVGFYKEDHVWVGIHDNGIKIYTLKGKLVRSFLANKTATDLFMDHAGGMWITTEHSGVYYVQSPLVTKKQFNPEYDHDITGITNVPNDGIYLAYDTGLVMKYTKGDVTVHSLKSKYNHPRLEYHTHFKTLIETSENHQNRTAHLKIGNKSVFNNAKEGQIIYATGIKKLVDDARKEIIIVGTGGFSHIDENFNLNNYKTDIRIIDAVRAPKGFYLATRKGLYQYSESKEIIPMASRDSLFSQSIYDINTNGHYYFAATHGQGVVVFNKNTVFTIRKSDGLFNNKIRKLYTQNDSTLWICTNAGVNRIRFAKDDAYSISGINQSDGLSYNGIKDVEVVDDTLWIATGKGVNVLPISVLDEPKQSRLFLKIKTITANGQPIDLEKPNKLHHKQNHLKINFQAVTFANKKLVYRYKLLGLESQWNYTINRTINYTSLPPGNYELILQATTQTTFEAHKEEQSFSFIITPPFYTLWRFKLIIVLIASYIIYLFFKIRIFIYNRDIIRELLRLFLKWLRRDQKFIVIKEQGKTVKIISSNIYYLKSCNNYIEIHTSNGLFTVRAKIGEFINELPDVLEFLRIHRSYIIRLDKIEKYDQKKVVVNNLEIPISAKYKTDYIRIVFSEN